MSNDENFEAELKALQEQAAKAAQKREWLRRQTGGNGPSNPSQPRTVQEVTPEEYARRLQNSLSRDSKIVKLSSDQRIAQSLKEWRKKVGPTFAEAHTQHQYILDKVANLGTGRQHQTSVVMAGGMGVGKAQPVSEPVALPDGSFAPIGTITPGDQLLTVTGHPVTVEAIHPQGVRRIYRVGFSDLSGTWADGEHLWLVRRAGETSWKTVTTEFLAELPDSLLSTYEIPVTAPIRFAEEELHLEPYQAGIVCATTANIINGPDGESENAWALLTRDGEAAPTLEVPSKYRTGTIQQRVQFLNGVFDEAGQLDNQGRFMIETWNRQLVAHLALLVQSLGGIAEVEEENGWYVFLPTLPHDMPLFSEGSSLHDVYSDATKPLPVRHFRSVAYSHDEEAVCVSVDHESHLYLTRNYIVTHNTWNAYAYLNKALQDGKVTAGQIVAGSEMTLLGNISRSGFRMEEKWEALLKPSAKLYFIDDVGKGSFMNREGRHAAWYSIVDHIYTHQLTLILTTNLEFEGRSHNSLVEWVGDAAYDRIKTMAVRNFIPSTVNKRETVWQGEAQPGRELPANIPPPAAPRQDFQHPNPGTAHQPPTNPNRHPFSSEPWKT